jgi:hypothetical protein
VSFSGWDELWVNWIYWRSPISVSVFKNALTLFALAVATPALLVLIFSIQLSSQPSQPLTELERDALVNQSLSLQWIAFPILAYLVLATRLTIGMLGVIRRLLRNRRSAG